MMTGAVGSVVREGPKLRDAFSFSSSHPLAGVKKGPTRGNQAHTLKELWTFRGALGQELCWGVQVI